MSNPPEKKQVAGVKLTPEQYRAIKQSAERCKMSLSAWMRSVLLQAAGKPARAGRGYLRIREPNGAMI